MPVAPFELLTPTSLAEALSLRREYGIDGVLLAGGQSLLQEISLGTQRPSVIIDLSRVGDLAGVELDGDELVIGAMTRQRDVERSRLVRERAALLPAAIDHVGTVATRNRGTIGGSIARADPHAELPAAVLTLDARMIVASDRGRRDVAAADFFTGPMTNALDPEEILVEIRIPAPRDGARTAFSEIARRHGHTALAAAAVRVVVDDDGAVTDARLVLAGVGKTPVRCREVERQLEQGGLRDVRAGVLTALADNTDRYRARMAAVAASRALAQVAG